MSARYAKTKAAEKRVICTEIMVSRKIDDHIHSCIGDEDHGDDHFCKGCHRWWGKRGA